MRYKTNDMAVRPMHTVHVAVVSLEEDSNRTQYNQAMRDIRLSIHVPGITIIMTLVINA